MGGGEDGFSCLSKVSCRSRRIFGKFGAVQELIARPTRSLWKRKVGRKLPIDLNGVCELKCIGRMRNGKIGIEN